MHEHMTARASVGGNKREVSELSPLEAGHIVKICNHGMHSQFIYLLQLAKTNVV